MTAEPTVPRVASVPSAHPYVAHLGAHVQRLPDPPVAGAPAGQWWPPAVLDPAWIAEHAGDVDLVHVHFGMESLPPGRLAAALDALRDAGTPLVHTVHDLENPQLEDQAAHAAALDLVIGRADALITLTPGAAAVVRERWDREVAVVPHPHVHPLDADLPPGHAADVFRIGLHPRALRPNVDGPGTLEELLAATRHLAGPVEVVVELHEDVRDVAARDAVRALCAGAPHATLHEGPRPDDDALATGLADLDAVVLPYRHGTHSGWLELCWDLGVPVVAPAGVGFMAEQHVDGSVATWDRGDADGLARALTGLLDASTGPGTAGRAALLQQRREQRRAAAGPIGAAHDALYAQVLRPHAR